MIHVAMLVVVVVEADLPDIMAVNRQLGNCAISIIAIFLPLELLCVLGACELHTAEGLNVVGGDSLAAEGGLHLGGSRNDLANVDGILEGDGVGERHGDFFSVC